MGGDLEERAAPSVKADKIATAVFYCICGVALLALIFSAHLPSSLGVGVSLALSAAAAFWTLWECRGGRAAQSRQSPVSRPDCRRLDRRT